jgi:hypothetical protein
MERNAREETRHRFTRSMGMSVGGTFLLGLLCLVEGLARHVAVVSGIGIGLCLLLVPVELATLYVARRSMEQRPH